MASDETRTDRGLGSHAVTAVDQLEQEIASRTRQQTALAELGQAALTGVDLSILFGQASALVEQNLDVFFAGVVEETAGGWRRRAAISDDTTFSNCPSCACGDESLLAYAGVSEAPVVFEALSDEVRFSAAHLASRHHVTSGVLVPIILRARRFGLVVVYSVTPRRFNAYEIQFISLLANILGEAYERGLTEGALRNSQWRLKQLVEAALDAVLTIDTSTRVLEWNHPAEITFGIAAGNALGRTLDELSIVPELAAQIRSFLRDEGLLQRRFETTAFRASGEEFPAELTITASGTGGEVVFTAFLRDLSESKRAAEALAASERDYRGLFENAHDAILIFDPATDLILDANSAACALYDLSREDLVGSSRSMFTFDIARGRDDVARTILSRESTFFEEIHVRGDASQVHLETKASLIVYRGRSAVLTVSRDVTARKEAERAVLASEARFRALAENSSDSIMLVDREGIIRYAGPSTSRVIGYSESELVGQSIYDLVHPRGLDAAREAFELLLASPREEVRRELRARSADGSYRWFEASSRNLFDEPAINAIVINYRDISERRRAQQQLDHQVYHDHLTDLPNRLLLRDRLSIAISHARRRRRGVAVMCLDLDHFKLIIDSLGHTIGDRVLQQVARRLQDCLRSDDTIARAGGDEFTIVLLDVERGEDAAIVARKILSSLTQPFHVEGHELFLSASIGITLYPGDGDDVEMLLKNADSAMFRAKELGRNNVQLFTASINHRISRRLTLERSLRRALENDELLLHYQPLYETATGRIASFEALVRWNDPKRGMVNPGEFIPMAEEARLIIPIGERVLRMAFAQLRTWKAAGINTHLAVNVSAHQLQSREFMALIDEMLAPGDIGADCLELEITETVAVQNLAWSMNVLQEVRNRGIRLAIDDFGTGQSSLIYLKRLPIDTIKIDQAFVHDLLTVPEDAAIVSSLIQLAHSLNLKVVAEGVETKEQYDFLKAQRCDKLQGFYFSRPVPAEAVPGLLERQ